MKILYTFSGNGYLPDDFCLEVKSNIYIFICIKKNESKNRKLWIGNCQDLPLDCIFMVVNENSNTSKTVSYENSFYFYWWVEYIAELESKNNVALLKTPEQEM